jgi:hypothetical protein
VVVPFKDSPEVLIASDKVSFEAAADTTRPLKMLEGDFFIDE